MEREDSKTDRAFWLMTGLLAGSVIVVAARVVFAQFSSKPTPYIPTSRNVIMAAATAAGLPDFAQTYFEAPEPQYYSEGDLAFSHAQQSSNPAEIEKYRRLISLTISSAPEMAIESQANLYYCLGKLDLLMSDENRAVGDFRSAVSKSRAIVEGRASVDLDTRIFLQQHALM